MKVKSLFIITAVLGLIFGIGFLFFSSTILNWYGVSVLPGTILLCRFFGGAILGQAIIAWAASKAAPSTLKLACTLCFFVSFLIGTVLSLIGVTTGILNPIAWPGVVIFLLLTLGFLFFRFIKPEKV